MLDFVLFFINHFSIIQIIIYIVRKNKNPIKTSNVFEYSRDSNDL